MKIFSKVFLTILIVCFAVIISVVPCFALPAWSDTGQFSISLPITYPVSITNSSSAGTYSIPFSPGTGFSATGDSNVGLVSLGSRSFRLTSFDSYVSIRELVDGAYVAPVGSFDYIFAPFVCNLSDFGDIIDSVSCTGLSFCELSLRAYDSSNTEQVVYLHISSGSGPSSNYDNLGSFLSSWESELGEPPSAMTLSDYLEFLLGNFGYDYLVIDSLLLVSAFTPPLVYPSVYFSDVLASDYYADFDFVREVETVVYEEIDLVGWVYDAINGLFSVELFGDITLGNLFLVIIAVPLLVSIFKAIAGG